MKKVTPKPVDPFNISMMLGTIEYATDELTFVSVGYRPSERHSLMTLITRMAIVHRRSPDNEEVTKELNMLLDRYEKEYSHLDL